MGAYTLESACVESKKCRKYERVRDMNFGGSEGESSKFRYRHRWIFIELPEHIQARANPSLVPMAHEVRI